MDLTRSSSYSRVAKEDPDVLKHKRAQYLINRELLKADTMRRRRPVSRLVISKLRNKFGSRLKRLRKTVHYTISVARAKVCVYNKILEQIKLWKQGIVFGKDADVMQFAPLFTLDVALDA